jgi:subtilisin family serine protease
MVAIRVLVTMPDDASVVASALVATMTPEARRRSLDLSGMPSSLVIDHEFAPVPIKPAAATQLMRVSPGAGAGGHGSFVVRATIDHEQVSATADIVDSQGRARIFSDPGIALVPACGGDAPIGSALDVARLIGVGRLNKLGMTGAGTAIAIVDNGINLQFLRNKGLRPKLDVHSSWSPKTTVEPGLAPVDHGTMCAYDALIGAPDATLLDYATLRTTRHGGSIMDGVLSDAITAYGKLLQLMSISAEERPFHSLVISNSWGVFSPDWDFPAGSPGRYIDNPSHPFHAAVKSLADAGADIVFAAGNCGSLCPDGRCNYPADQPTITGANSYPEVITVAGADVNRNAVGYSSRGPGAIDPKKPDIAGYTHFKGSCAFGDGEPDSGTSAACPVVAGVIAAFRSVYPYAEGDPSRSPAAVKQFLLNSAIQLPGTQGFSYDTGYGIIDTGSFAEAAHSLAASGNLPAASHTVNLRKPSSKKGASRV